MTTTTSAREAIAAIQGHEAWAIIRRSTRAGARATVGVIGDRRTDVESILDVPLAEGVPEDGHIADRLIAVPVRQVRERGFETGDEARGSVPDTTFDELVFVVEGDNRGGTVRSSWVNYTASGVPRRLELHWEMTWCGSRRRSSCRH